MKRRKTCDRVLMTCVLVLLLIGILMVFSSSFYYSLQRFSDPYYFLKKELLWAAVGLVLMALFANINYKKLQKWAVPALVVLFLMLLAVLFTPLGIELNGARRWISIAGFTIMPGELAKPALTLFLAATLSRDSSRMQRFKDFSPYVMILIAVFGLIVKQPNLSTALIILSLGFVLLFIAGLPMGYVFGSVTAGVVAAVGLILTSEYRMNGSPPSWTPSKDTSEKGLAGHSVPLRPGVGVLRRRHGGEHSEQALSAGAAK